MKKVAIYIIVWALLTILTFGRFFWDSWHFSVWKKYLNNLQYNEAIGSFSQLSSSPTWLYNMGNVWYSYAETLEDTERVQALEETLSLYGASLQEMFDQQTQDNYEYVQSLLAQEPQDDSKEQLSQESENESPNETWSGTTDTWGQSDSEKEEGIWDESGQSSDSATQWTSQERWEEYKLQESDNLQELSPGQKQALEQHINNLQLDQLNNQRYFWKQQQKNDPIFQGTFGQSLFRNNSENQRNDW